MLIKDMGATSVDQYYFMALDYPYESIPVFFVCDFLGVHSTGAWMLRSIPADPTVSPVTTIYTARRRGFYFNSETDQSNIGTMHWQVEENDPTRTITS